MAGKTISNRARGLASVQHIGAEHRCSTSVQHIGAAHRCSASMQRAVYHRFSSHNSIDLARNVDVLLTYV